jgi:RNA polymerase sigma-70 factor (ECF subfamily)
MRLLQQPVKAMLAEGLSDAECVKRIQQGDTDSFEILVRRHQKPTFNLVYRLLGNYDEAAEIAQEVFLSAYRSIHQFRGDANFSTWLYRIAFNQASTRRKSVNIEQNRHVALESVEIAGDGADDPAKTFARKEIQLQVQQALNSLDKDEALIILLRDLQDVPYEEVAQMLDIPIGTVKSRLHRARQALKARLAPYFYANREAS